MDRLSQSTKVCPKQRHITLMACPLICKNAATHQVHCVGLLWRFAHRHHWDYRSIWNMSEIVLKLHTNHCFLALFRIITCQADVTPTLFQLDSEGYWRTRNAPHLCKSYDARMQWQKANSVCRINCEPANLPSQSIRDKPVINYAT